MSSPAPRLDQALIAARSDLDGPDYDRGQSPGVVHLGVGAFHKAHQATLFDALMRAGEAGWMIVGVSLRSPDAGERLNPQDGLYTVLERGPACEARTIVGSLQRVLLAPADPAAVVAAMAARDTSLVTLTVTEKGYVLDPATGRLLTSDAGVAADMVAGAAPRTTPGFLVAALAARRRLGSGPLTILSCDNLPNNGARVQAAVLDFAERVDSGLRRWIEANAAFPSCMVDRIVPATLPEDIDALSSAAGYRDEAMVRTEPFLQWVIEDRFAGPRPPLDRVGVQFTSDVDAWERAKLRLLNGAHSALAYLGGLAGYSHVHEALSDPAYLAYLNKLWDEVEPGLQAPSDLDVGAYRSELLRRFANPALPHRLMQIAMDGSQKLPQRLLASIRVNRKAGRDCSALTLAVAGWMRWQQGLRDDGLPFDVDDPLSAVLVNAIHAEGTPEGRAGALLGVEAVFGADLRADVGFRDGLIDALARLERIGAAAAVKQLVAI